MRLPVIISIRARAHVVCVRVCVRGGAYTDVGSNAKNSRLSDWLGYKYSITYYNFQRACGQTCKWYLVVFICTKNKITFGENEQKCDNICSCPAYASMVWVGCPRGIIVTETERGGGGR